MPSLTHTTACHRAVARARRALRNSMVALVVLGACASSPRLESTWADPAFQDAGLRRLLVVSVGRTPGERRIFEDRFAQALRARGVDAQASYPLIGDARVDSAVVDAQMHLAGCDGIFVSRVVDRQLVRRYYGTTFGPSGYRGYAGPASWYHAGWWPYYAGGYAYASAATFASTDDQRVSIETNLYRHDNRQLIWSGLSRQWLTATQGSGDAIDGVVAELASELARSHVVHSVTQP